MESSHAKLVRLLANLDKKDFNSRCEDSGPIEVWMRAMINSSNAVLFNGIVLNNWQKCSEQQDYCEKKDSFHVFGSTDLYMQSKYRQPNSGDDILSALVQPWAGTDYFMKMMDENNLEDTHWGRDYKFQGHFYASMDKKFETIRVIALQDIHAIRKSLIQELFDFDEGRGFKLSRYLDGRCFESKIHKGAMFRHHLDGKSSKTKVLEFLPLALFPNATVIPVDTNLPDYMIEYVETLEK